jgi:hypothetical protein
LGVGFAEAGLGFLGGGRLWGWMRHIVGWLWGVEGAMVMAEAVDSEMVKSEMMDCESEMVG